MADARSIAAAMATIAADERARRVTVLRRDIAAGRITRTRAQADELLWFEIEMWARRAAGVAEGRRYGLPNDYAALLATAQATRTAAAKGTASVEKQVALRDLHHWLVLNAIVRPALTNAAIDREALAA